MAAGLGQIATGAISGGMTGAQMGGVPGALAGGIIGGLGGFLTGQSSTPTASAPIAPSTNYLGSTFNQPRNPAEQQQALAMSILKRRPDLGTPENAMKWYSNALWNSQHGGMGPEVTMLGEVHQEVQQGQMAPNMASPEQQAALFGQQGASFLQTAPTSQITTPTQALQQAQGLTGTTPAVISQLGMEAGIAPMSIEEQARQDQVQAAQRTAMLQPIQQQIASAQATQERGLAARGLGYDPMLARLGMEQSATAGQQVGLQQALMNEQRRQSALSALPGMAGQGIQQALAPAGFLSDIQGKQAAIGQQQAQLGMQGFGTLGQLAHGQSALDTDQYKAQITTAQKSQEQEQKSSDTAFGGFTGALGALGSLASTMKKKPEEGK